MNRQLALLNFALGALGRRRGRSLALSMGLAFTVGLFGSAWMLSQALQAEMLRLTGAAPDLTVQQVIAGRPASIPVERAETLRALPGVRNVRPRVWGYLYLGVLDANLTLVGVEPNQAAQLVAEGALRLAEGAPPSPQGASMWLGAELASRLELQLGDKLALPGPDGPVVLKLEGTLRQASALRTTDVIFVSNPTAREVLDLAQGQATDLALALSQPREAPLLADKIQKLLPGRQRVLDKAQLRRAYGQSFGSRSGLMMAALLPVLASLLLISFDRLSGMNESERREIGVLRAVGFLTQDVLAVRMWESLALALTGSLVGLLGAYGFVFGLDAPILGQLLLGYSSLYPPLSLTPMFNLSQAVAVVALVSVPFTAVSLIPAWHAAVVNPASMLRGGS